MSRAPRIHLSTYNGGWYIDLGKLRRRRPHAWFRSPALLQVVLRSLRYMDRKGYPEYKMAEVLMRGEKWAMERA